MIYVHCNECDHEWECTEDNDRTCDWCGGSCYILESDTHTHIIKTTEEVITDLEKLNNPLSMRIIEKLKKHGNKNRK